VRISTTTLESFRLWRVDRIDEAELVATIKGEFVPTWRVLFGRAYGKVLEQPDVYRVPDGYACNGYRFEADAVDPALATIDRRGLFEVKATREYGEHIVVAKVDHILGADITEFKTRFGPYQVEKYARSCQWRFELDVFGAERVTYRVFRFSQDPIALDAIEELPLYPYPQLHDECCALVDAFAVYVRRRRLEFYLQPRFEDAPTKPSAASRLQRLRDWLRSRRVIGNDDDLPPAAVRVAELPEPRFTLRPPFPARPRQASLF